MGFKSDLPGSQRDYYPGVFINSGTLDEIEIAFDAAAMEGWDNRDVVIRTKVAQKGLSFTKDIIMIGNYKYEDDGVTVRTEHGTFKIWNVFRNLSDLIKNEVGVNARGHLVVDGKAIDSSEFTKLDFMKGLPVFVLDYRAGQKDDDPTKSKYYTYKTLWVAEPGQSEEEAKAALLSDFLTSVDGGYVKGFEPPVRKVALVEIEDPSDDVVDDIGF